MYKLSKVPIKTRMRSISLIDIVEKQKKTWFHTSTKLSTQKYKKIDDFSN